MDQQHREKVPVSEADRAKSYFKYYDRPPASIAPEKMGKVFGPPMSPSAAIPFVERGRLLTGECPAETGYCVMPDGTGYVCDVTFIPGAAAEMVDWYFAWRGLEPLRDVIADPWKHLSAMSMQTCYALDEDRTLQEKYWDTTQVLVRMDVMGPKTDYLNLKCPSDVGFNCALIGPDKDTKTLICGRNYAKGEPPAAPPDHFICHQVKEAAGGVQVITRIWSGWTVRYGQSYKALPDGFWMQPHIPMSLLASTAFQWAGLAAILPSLYGEEKDNF